MIRKMNVAERKLKTWKNMAKVSLQSTRSLFSFSDFLQIRRFQRIWVSRCAMKHRKKHRIFCIQAYPYKKGLGYNSDLLSFYPIIACGVSLILFAFYMVKSQLLFESNKKQWRKSIFLFEKSISLFSMNERIYSLINKQ